MILLYLLGVIEGQHYKFSYHAPLVVLCLLFIYSSELFSSFILCKKKATRKAVMFRRISIFFRRASYSMLIKLHEIHVEKCGMLDFDIWKVIWMCMYDLGMKHGLKGLIWAVTVCSPLDLDHDRNKPYKIFYRNCTYQNKTKNVYEQWNKRRKVRNPTKTWWIRRKISWQIINHM